MTKREKQISRITQMENNLNELNEASRKLSDALDTFCDIQAKVKKLGDYYGSETWRQDYSDDEKGLLPPDLKRGVLSEDGAYNALSDCRELYVRMLDIVSKELHRGTI